MYVISSRKGFWDNIHLLPPNKDYKIKKIRGRGKKGRPKTEAEYKAHICGKKVLLLCHGYNNYRRDVLNAYFGIMSQEAVHTKYFEAVVGYTWPSSTGPASYPHAKKKAPEVARRFSYLLEATIAECSELGVMSHSMGCLISLIAHERLRKGGVKKATKHWQFLMAAAVSHQSIEQGRAYYDATSYCDKTYVFFSKKDGALRNWYAAGEKRSGGQGEIALGYNGPQNPSNISPPTKIIDCQAFVKRHSRYKKTQQIYEYIRDELKNNYRKPKSYALQ